MPDSNTLIYLQTKAPFPFIVYASIVMALMVMGPVLFWFVRHSKYESFIVGKRNTLVIIFILNIFATIVLGGVYFIFGYSKTFDIYAYDEHNDKIYDIIVKKFGQDVDIDREHPKIKINSKELYCSIVVQSKAKKTNLVVKNEDFVNENVLKFPLSDRVKSLSLSARSKDFKSISPRYLIFDSGGIDFLIPPQRVKNSIKFQSNNAYSGSCFEFSTEAAFYQNDASLLINLNNSISVLLGEGTLSTILVKVNKMHKSDTWVDERKIQLSEPLRLHEPFIVSLTVLRKEMSTVLDLLVTSGHKVSKATTIEIDNLRLPEVNNIEVGAVATNKTTKPCLRLLAAKISANSADTLAKEAAQK